MKKFILFLFLLFSAINQSFAFDNSKPPGDTNPIPMTTSNGISTYRAQVADLVPAATATDVITLCGSATKTVYVTYIQATADATSASVIDFYVYLRTAANTGGTSTAVTPTKYDQLNASPTATIVKYSANPSALGAGTLVSGDHYALPAAASTGYPGVPWVEEFGKRNTQPIILRGVAQCLSFSLDGQAIPAGFGLYFGIEWLEK